AEH
ncbi:ATP-dependent RNA helicase DeaD, partial [Haemophilus influenzae]